ncbi:MAG: Uncharacterized protein Greene041679_340 [Parcubacteria group bacterium Greene0416_79]|nr:MAG: Uncharacterized protein Greene041679_340 [Parcubacteria group bacterium Greene0416_79]
MTEVDSEEKDTEDVATRVYEVGFHIAPSVPEEAVGAEGTAIRDALLKEGAQVIAEEFPKSRLLSYGMRVRVGGRYVMYTNAYFGWIKFEAAADAVRRIEEALRRFERVPRFILVQTIRGETMTVPRAPRLEVKRVRREAPQAVSGQPAPAPVSEVELEKSLEKIIAE